MHLFLSFLSARVVSSGNRSCATFPSLVLCVYVSAACYGCNQALVSQIFVLHSPTLIKFHNSFCHSNQWQGFSILANIVRCLVLCWVVHFIQKFQIQGESYSAQFMMSKPRCLCYFEFVCQNSCPRKTINSFTNFNINKIMLLMLS